MSSLAALGEKGFNGLQHWAPAFLEAVEPSWCHSERGAQVLTYLSLCGGLCPASSMQDWRGSLSRSSQRKFKIQNKPKLHSRLLDQTR